MAKFLVLGLVDATVFVHVEAETALDAANAADLPYPSVCNQCSREIEIGDIYAVQVLAEDGHGEIEYTDDQAALVPALQKEIERLKAELAKAKRATRKPAP